MKRIGWIWCCLLFQYGMAQSVDLKELTTLLDLGQNKLEAHLQKRGYRRSFPASPDERYFRREDKAASATDIRGFKIIDSKGAYELAYQTTSAEDYMRIKEQLQSAGFTCPQKLPDTSTILYQRENISIQSYRKKEDSTLFYVWKACRKTLPRRKDIVSAEDLLQLDGQEYLIEVFGRENVKTDWFFYDVNDSNICSVLFPNTNREAIFVWNDETNLRDISFILLGGDVKTKETAKQSIQVSANAWVSRQGVYCGMTLSELEALNKEPVRFYNWHAASAGYLAPNNKGSLDFNRLGLVFNCQNCAFLPLGKSDIVASDQAREENQKVFITSLIMLPERRMSDRISHN